MTFEPHWPTVESLIWFFSGAAEADAGVRSVQGGFEATMHRLALTGRPAPGHVVLTESGQEWAEGEIPVHETRATASRFDLPVDDAEAILPTLVSQVDRFLGRRAPDDRAQVLSRVRTMGRRGRAVLELQFGDELWLCGPRVDLAQKACRERRWGISLGLLCCMSQIADVMALVNGRREKKGERPVDPREAIALLLIKDDSASVALVDEIRREAESAVNCAVSEYERTRG